MKLKNIVKSIVVIQWLLLPLFLVLSSFLEKKLPETLQEYFLWEAERALTTTDIVIVIVILLVLILHLVSSIGVFLFKQWAKNIYIATIILLILLSPFLGPSVEHGITEALSEISLILTGVILALLLFTSVYKDNTSQN